MRLNKFAGLMAVGSAVALFGSVAHAQLAASPTSSDDMGYTADVAMQCAVDTPSAYTNAGSTAQAYAETTGTINSGLTRVVQLEASDTIGFDCNSDAVDLTVLATTVTGPAFNNATDIDLLSGSDTIGVDHVVDVAVDTSTTALVTDVQALTANTTIVSPATGQPGDDVPTDVNGDIDVTVTSTFLTAGGAEELAEGTYASAYTVTVTAQ